MSKAADRGFHVLIPAAGSGQRSGSSIPKQYVEIGGKAVLRHTIEKFIGLDGLKSIRVIIDLDHLDFYKTAVVGLDLPPPVFGGETRKDSVRNGLSHLCHSERSEESSGSAATFSDKDLILIHDAARPFISVENVTLLMDAMNGHAAATLAVPLADTLVDVNYTAQDRNKLYAVQTPQAFTLGLLRKAHEMFADDTRFTDDAGLVAALGEKVALVPGSRANFKITTKDDLDMAEKLLDLRETRTGFGYDVHAFDPAPATHARLGGVDIPHARKLLGHSDADVALHALTDALLGTIGEGDIGQLFPPSDPQWKGADSAVFLKEAVQRVWKKHGRIVNVDITVIAEEPKIGPHRLAMQERIAGILGLTPDRVGVKATTNEKLGFLGRAEGIAAQAVASVSFPA